MTAMARKSRAPRALVLAGNGSGSRFLVRLLVAERQRAEVVTSVALARAYDPSVVALVLVDGSTLAEDTVAACKALRAWARNVAILVLLPAVDPLIRVRVLDAGADGLLDTPFDVRELAARVRSLTRRGDYERLVKVGPLVVDRTECTALVAGNLVPLRPRERDLLVLLLRSVGETVSRQRILREGFGAGGGNPRTVDAWITHLRAKLGAWSGLIESVHGVGYRFVGFASSEGSRGSGGTR